MQILRDPLNLINQISLPRLRENQLDEGYIYRLDSLMDESLKQFV